MKTEADTEAAVDAAQAKEDKETKEVLENCAMSELKYFRRKKKYRTSIVEPLPVRVMTHMLSRSEYASVPHQWQCDGRLLVLQDPANRNNYQIFQVS